MWCALRITIYEVCFLPRPQNRVRKCLCKVRTLKIQSRSLNKPRKIFFEIFWRERSLKGPNKLCVKIWGCGEVIWGSYTSCAGWATAEDHVMLFLSQTHWYESSYCNFFQLVLFELNKYTSSPRNIKRLTSSHRLDATIIGTPHFT